MAFVFEHDAGAAAGVAELAPVTVKSERHRFIADGWFSNDTHGLSADNPEASQPAKPLTPSKRNRDASVDLALSRRLSDQSIVTASGIADRDVASAVLQRLSPSAREGWRYLRSGTLPAAVGVSVAAKPRIDLRVLSQWPFHDMGRRAKARVMECVPVPVVNIRVV